MKSKLLFAIVFPLLLLLLTPFSFGAGGKQAAAISHKGPTVFFSSTKYEFEPVAEGVIVRHHFIVQNKGDKTLLIDKVRTG